MTNAETWFDIALRPRKPEGSLGRTAQDGHLDSHTAPELCFCESRVRQQGLPAWATVNTKPTVSRFGLAVRR